MPKEVWSWYLYRRTVCRKAAPNSGHYLLAELEKQLEDRFLLVTQNVDGLHLRAGNSLQRTYQVHGNINYMRCWLDCCLDQFPIPEEVGELERGQELSSNQHRLLQCPKCEGPSRPHVLWFDECYDEERFRFQSSLRKAQQCDILVSVGSSGSTNLPTQMVQGAAAKGALLIDVNPERGLYAQLAEQANGFWVKSGAGEGLEQVATGLGLNL